MASTIKEDRLQSGYGLSHPPPGDEVVIAGVSGCFPDCDSVIELQEKLFNKIDLVSCGGRRWNLSNPEIPQRAGVINDLHKFDASFFGIHYEEAHTMDPVGRILLEKAYEAIFDAGMNLNELRGSKTGVFVGASFCESEKTWIHGELKTNGFGIVGCSRAMLANRISYWLGVTGPSYAVDTACASSLYALEHAFRAIREGRCESAIACGSNLCLDPYNTLQYSRSGILSHDGKCKTFDENANGYVRSEAVCAVFLQKAKNCRRAYAQIFYAKTSCDGFKEQGITHPCVDARKILLREFYEECSVQPCDLEFLEAHGTGTRVGDLVELKSIDAIFTPGRSAPLKIGSVKSNMGHCENGSGMCAIAKMCIAYSTGYIPPNLHYKTPRKDVSALIQHRLEVVTDKTSWGRGLAGVNCFGFGGANAHVLLKSISRDKINEGLPFDDLPRLVCVSGRTDSAVAKILTQLEARPIDNEFVKLLHSVHNLNIPGHIVRGYTLLGSTPNNSVTLAHDVQYSSGVLRPVWFVFSGMGSQWAGMASNLMKIPVFAAAIQKSHMILEPKGINLTAIVTDEDPKIFNNMLNSYIGIVAMQIGLTDVLKTINIKPDHTIGRDIGELTCAYACGSLTAEETILSAYNKGLRFLKLHSTDGFISAEDTEYYQNLVTFEETISCIDENAITIEVGPHVGFQSRLRSSLKDAVCISLMEKNEKDNVLILLNALGRLYEAGLNPHLAKIYPDVPFPVSQGTPMLAHLVDWDHSDDWCVPSFNMQINEKLGERTFKISLEDQSYEYLAGHVIDGRIICPAAVYLMLVWETFGVMRGSIYSEVSVVFENIRFHRTTYIVKDSTLEFTIKIQKGSGDFEVLECGATIVTGRIYKKQNVGENYNTLPFPLENAGSNNELSYLNSKDFYKEIRLRGIHHSGSFLNVLEWNIQNNHGRVSWINNWVTFLDSLLQIKIFSIDTRAPTILTYVDKLSIDINMHYDVTSKMNQNSINNYLEVKMYSDIDVIRSGGVEVRGIHAKPISLRPDRDVPVLEKSNFFTNFGQSHMKIEEVLRIYIQLIVENIKFYKIKTIEFIDDDYKRYGYKPVLKAVEDILRDVLLVRPEMILVSDNLMQMSQGTTIINTLHGQSNVAMFIGANLLVRPNILRQAVSTLGDKCFIVSREKKRPDPQQFSDRFDVICIQNTGIEYLVLFRKRAKARPTKFINIETSDQNYAWIDKVKNELKDGQKLVLYNQNEPFNGLLGLVQCLRLEPGGENVYGLLIADSNAPAFNQDEEFYKQQLDKDLVINIYQNGQWGTYRHLLLEDVGTVSTSHAYVNTVAIGDLSSLRWLEGHLTKNHEFKNPFEVLVHVYCAALNFRDVMTAMGRISINIIACGRLAQECAQGIEIAGKTNNGSRVMAIVSSCGLSNLAVGFKPVLMPIPDKWTFEEAATVPVAYSTAYYAMVMVGKMQRGESILIHAGSGGVGQAAINVALHYGCEIFTTVGTAVKRAFIKKLFPQLKDSHIGNSRDTTFEEMIRRETNGMGVDLVLNSLSDDKLQASIRCLGTSGRFLEIGKFDISNNTSIGMHFFRKEVSFYSIMMDYMIETFELDEIQRLQKLILNGIENGAVRPLTYSTFKEDEVEAAYRYMAAGKHVGKVIIKVRNEDQNNISTMPTQIPIEATPRYTCHEDRVYILVGGLGGFGLELADWLILRGARKILLTSRHGVVNGYQAYRLRAWASYGVEVQISTDDGTTEAGCKAIFTAANAMGAVEAIFNLAVVLHDAVFQNQTPESFRISFMTKAMTTIHLDKLSRKMCPKLKHFVVFSSISCARGTAGQTNYGFSNSVMEKICEKRRESGLPALAIQWGAIGDVGLLANTNDAIYSGTLQQRISSCLLVLDKFMNQEATIVTSYVVAEKKASGSDRGNIIEVIAQIIGIKDLKNVSHQASFAELGMDSMTSVEIKQTLEREYELFLTPHDIRIMTFSKLLELSTRKEPVSTTLSGPF